MTATKCTVILLSTIVLLLLLCSPMVHGVVWAWMLTDPAASIAQDGNGSGDVARQHSARSIATKHAGARNGDLLTGSEQRLQLHHHRHHHSKDWTCGDDRDCGRGFFCDRHYGKCMPYRQEGEHCRRDNHCDRGHECVFGRCRKHVRKGERGSKCRNDKDCGSNMCCARHHGEHVCKQLLPVGHRCFVPNGGLDYALNEVCPCEEGILCKSTGKLKPKVEDLSWKPWSENEIFRCAIP